MPERVNSEGHRVASGIFFSPTQHLIENIEQKLWLPYRLFFIRQIPFASKGEEVVDQVKPLKRITYLEWWLLTYQLDL